MADGDSSYVRAAGRKATVEIQKRPGAKRGGGRQGDPSSGNDPARLPMEIQNAFAQQNFDPLSAILACNFPPSVTINQAGNFFRWIGPVVRVDRADSLHMESNFIVVFATAEHAAKAIATDLLWDDNQQTKIYTRMADKRPSIWDDISAWLGWGDTSTPDQAGGQVPTQGAAAFWVR